MQDKLYHVGKIIGTSSPFASDFLPDSTQQPKTRNFLASCKILIIGAGGLGCELLKNLALSGFQNINVIDMDTIDVSNLNRQFLFRPQDVGKPKAVVAAEFINKRISGAKVVPHYCKIQDFDRTFYKQFSVIVCGLDSIPARRWINSMLIEMIDFDNENNPDPDTIIPMVDGGTEGFKGQTRVILPTLSACIECSLEMFPPQKTYPICTIASTPRIPEHCIQWASIIAWEKEKPFVHGDNVCKIDTDNPEHMLWLFEKAKKRAEENNIPGVTYRLTQGVVKNIIPAIASTNAVIAASCSNEVFKIATNTAPTLNNWMMYNGAQGIYTYTYEYAKKDDCIACGTSKRNFEISSLQTLEQFIQLLADDPNLQLKKPSLTYDGKPLFMSAPPGLYEQTKDNLNKSLGDLITSGSEIVLTDPSLENVAITLKINFI
eukprot:TRINITY_DN2802_c3_g1_i1.p1 TRINITY_DN2802_c3_g1~~TRINITY_DN2802_c3_g1_i1.p1  ORF type:complete len:447 (-),score=195.56 TRINITY_DN2802_c3_g1_i1:101-1396(-)